LATQAKVLCEVKDEVMWITLNRPEKLNALDAEMRRGILSCLEDAEARDDVRVVVIRGSGKAFSAGADVSLLKSLSESSVESVTKSIEEIGIQRIGMFIRSMKKPVIAFVSGYCIGGGFEIVQYCDLVYATPDAVFSQGEINIGIIPGGGGTQMLPRLVGEKKAKELIFTGKRITAEEAKRLGIVNEVFESDKAEEELLKVISELKAKSPYTLALAKRAINTALEAPLSAGLSVERLLFINALTSDDGKEGVRAFIEKRKPVWRGRV